MRLFVNRSSLAFGDEDNYDADATFDLTADDVREGRPKAVSGAGFRKFTSLCIFVENNQGDRDQTVINKITLTGTVSSTAVRYDRSYFPLTE